MLSLPNDVTIMDKRRETKGTKGGREGWSEGWKDGGWEGRQRQTHIQRILEVKRKQSNS